MMQKNDKSSQLIARIQQDGEEKLAKGKDSAARKNSFAARSLQEYLGEGQDIPLADVTREWVEGYVKWLQTNGKSDNTLSNYLRVMLNTFRLAVKAGESLDLSIFEGFFKGNSKSRKKILTLPLLHAIADGDLNDYAVLNRTREVFLLCFFGGGLRISDLLNDTERLADLREAQNLFNKYAIHSEFSFLGADVERAYLHNLQGVTHLMNIPFTLTDDSAAEAWVEAAKVCGIPAEVISRTVGRALPNLNYVPDEAVTEEQVSAALSKVAGRIGIYRYNWYALRCYNLEPQEALEMIQAMPDLQTVELKHYIPEVKADTKDKKRNMKSMERLLFINCLPVDAMNIFKVMQPPLARMFTYRVGLKHVPSPISNEEMRTFMYLSDVAAETITYYFPEEVAQLPKFERYDEVEILEGVLAGKTAHVYRTGHDKLSVVVRFESMNMYYTAEVPIRFLKIVKKKKK
jgi:transcription antitermination factor NusG